MLSSSIADEYDESTRRYQGGTPMDGDQSKQQATGRNKDTRDKYGLNLREWTRLHEEGIATRLVQGDDPRRLLDWHERKLAWLQHERLIHLGVMMITVAVFLVALAFMVLVPSTIPVSTIIYLAMLGLLIGYIRYYFFLENTVQHWYRIADDLHERVEALDRSGSVPAHEARDEA